MNKPLNPRDDPFDALIRCGFYPLAACTALGVLFWRCAMGFTRSIQHGHLLWNVILAWVPYVLQRRPVDVEAAAAGRHGIPS
jgi:hypothetical protein